MRECSRFATAEVNVLHINTHLAQKGGVETYLLSLLPLLRERGLTQRVVYGSGEAGLFDGAIHIEGIGRHGFREEKVVRRLVREVLDAERPDVVHVHNIDNVGVLQASLEYGPTILTSHDYRTICPASLLFHKRTQEVCSRHAGLGCFATTVVKHCLTPRPQYAAYFYHRTRWIMRHASRFARVVTPSRSVKDRLMRAGFAEHRVEVLPYFCPLPPTSQPRPLPAATTITFMGRIAGYKGYAYFIAALGRLPDRIRGLMVGNFTPSNERHVRELAREHGCEGRLELRPWASRDAISEVLDATTVLIFPSVLPETLGIVGLEAFSRGVPVVASDIGGVREWLTDRVNGRLVAPKSAEQIRDAVLDLVADERSLIDFGSRGIATIQERFLPSTHTEKLLGMYAQAVG
jgi:glycosyltransferase involved in cell wall biosynthesis